MSLHRALARSAGLFVITLSAGATPAVAQIYGVSVTPHEITASRLPSNGIHYTVAFTVHDTSTGTGSTTYILLTNTRTAGLTTVSITGLGVTQADNPDSAQLINLPAGSSAVATVTYSVDDGAAGSVDTLVFLALALASPATLDTGKLIVTRVKPGVTVEKSVAPGGTPAPGTDLTYTLTLTNVGNEKAASVVHVDSVPAQLGFKVGSVSATLPSGMTATVAYSNNGGTTWTYVPVSAGCGAPAGYDYCVRDLRVSLGDNLNGGGPNNIVEIVFIAKVK